MTKTHVHVKRCQNQGACLVMLSLSHCTKQPKGSLTAKLGTSMSSSSSAGGRYGSVAWYFRHSDRKLSLWKI